MGLDKVLDFLRKFWIAHSPTVFAILVVLLAVNFYALPPGKLVDIGKLWKSVKDAIDSTSNEMGIKVERGYVIFGLLYLGLIAIEWISSLLMRLPGLPLITRFRICDIYTAYQAGRVLGAENNFWEIEDRLRVLLEKYRQAFIDQKERSPFEWLADRAMLWSRYYGLALLVTAALLTWWAFGSIDPRESRRIIHLIFATIAFAALARWRHLTLRYRKNTWECSAALRACESEQQRRDEGFKKEEARGKAFASFWEHRCACSKHPAEIIRRLSDRLQMPLLKVFIKRLNYPQYWEPSDWRLFASSNMRCVDEDPIKFSALRTKDFEGRFASLLECHGSGICILANEDLGIAPATSSRGAAYCIGSRSHNGSTLRLQLSRYGHQGFGDFHIQSTPNHDAYLIDLGLFPIERVAQFELPHALGLPYRNTPLKTYKADLLKWAETSESQISATAEAYPGHSYLWLSEFSDTVDVIVGFQCFAIEGRDGCLLILYRILQVEGVASSAPPVSPWWRPVAWASLLKPPPANN
jgi:hypothetical protein